MSCDSMSQAQNIKRVLITMSKFITPVGRTITKNPRKNRRNFTKHLIISRGNTHIENVIHNIFNYRESSFFRPFS